MQSLMFSTNRNMMGPAGLGDRVVEVNQLAVEMALAARDEADAGRPILVAGSMSHQVPIVPGTQRRQDRPLPPDDDGFGLDIDVIRNTLDWLDARPWVRADWFRTTSARRRRTRGR